MIFRGDDTNAFGDSFITINLTTESEVTITKAVFKSGKVLKEFENPTFPLQIDLTAEETTKLDPENRAFLAVYDENGLKRTCEGSLVFNTLPQRV